MDYTVRPWRKSDAAALAQALNNKNVQDNLRDGIPYPYTEADAADFIESMLAADRNAVYAFAVEAQGRVAGSVGVFRKDNIHFRTAELGYYIAEPLWGRGIATGAVKSVCEYIFEKTDIVRIFAEPFAHNSASCRVLEKNGFVCEGILKDNAYKNGRLLDMKLYALVKE